MTCVHSETQRGPTSRKVTGTARCKRLTLYSRPAKPNPDSSHAKALALATQHVPWYGNVSVSCLVAVNDVTLSCSLLHGSQVKVLEFRFRFGRQIVFNTFQQFEVRQIQQHRLESRTIHTFSRPTHVSSCCLSFLGARCPARAQPRNRPAPGRFHLQQKHANTNMSCGIRRPSMFAK